jgi:hypothetical protein
MTSRDSNLPLITAFVLAIVLHALLLPLFASDLFRSFHPDETPPPLDPALPTDDPLALGRDQPQLSTVAWISYDDFQKLLATQSTTEQPALQQDQDPLAHAPIEMNPTPPAPSAPDAPAPAAAAAPDLSAQPQQPAAAADSPLRTDPLPPSPAAQTIPLTQPMVALMTPAPPMPQPADPSLQNPADPADPTSAKPTSAPRSDRQSPPVTIEGNFKIVPGEVLTGQGIEIKTAVPRFSVVTLVSTIPRNPTVQLTFDPDGRVIRADILQSAGSENVDGPVLASLYKWKASGEKFEQLHSELQLEVTLLLVRP